RQNQNKDRRGGKALQRGRGYHQGAGTEHDAGGREYAEQPADDVRPRLALQPASDGEQEGGGRQLTAIEPGERRTDPVALSVSSEIIGQERVGREIGGVNGAEHDAEPPDQRIVPVRPPAAAGSG